MHQLADFRRTREADLGDVHMTRKRLAGFLAHAVDYLQCPCRAAGLNKQFRGAIAAQWRLFCRLQDGRVAGCQRRCDFPQRHQQRIVPRRDTAHDADRFSQGGTHYVVFRRRDRTRYLVDTLGKVLNGFDTHRHVDADHVRDRFAHVECIHQGEFGAVFADQLRPPVHHRHALARRLAGPFA